MKKQKRAGRPRLMDRPVRKTVILPVADVVYVETKIDKNFSAAIRYLIEAHRQKQL